MAGNIKVEKGGTVADTAADNIQAQQLVPVGFDPVPEELLAEAPLNLKSVRSSKNKLWLIKVPHNFDPAILTGQSVIINGSLNLPPINKERYEIQAFQCESDQLSSFRTVLPSQKNECLMAAKPFTGQVNVLRDFAIPHVEVPQAPSIKDINIPEDLPTRWKPFGWKKPKRLIETNIKMESEQSSCKMGENNITSPVLIKLEQKNAAELPVEEKRPKKKQKKRHTK